jgi:formylglycine-generating enzyme required for sulfatase activity
MASEVRLMRRFPLVTLSLALSLLVGVFPLSAQDARNVVRTRTGNQKWAVLIGVDDYTYVKKLESCGQDMRSLRERLLASDFPDLQVFLLHDKAEAKKYLPFKENIEAQLDRLLGKVDENGKLVSPGLVDSGDLVVVAFSGHGVLVDGASYLCPVGTRLGEPDTLVSVDGVYKRLSACRASQKLLVIDACRNDPRPNGQKGPKATDETQGFARSLSKPPEGILVLASCSPGQVSWEDSKDLGHGVFMHFVLKGLKGEAKDKDGEVTMLSLYKYANRETKLYVEHHFNEVQTPELWGKLQGDFAIGPTGNMAGGAVPPPVVPVPLDCTGAKGVSAEDVKKAQEVWAKYLGRRVEEEDEIAPGVKMKFVLVPPGKFLMGSPENEKGHDSDEVQHEVRISRPFYLGKTVVTQAEYQALMGTNPSHFSANGKGAAAVKGLNTARFPVENLSWKEADDFARKLTLKNAGVTYRLPYEAEWEYACRGGCPSSSPFGLGEGTSLSTNQANFKGKKTCAVGSYPANVLGLYDMHGNVWQWCLDCYGDYPTAKVIDPMGPPEGEGKNRVCRGGAYDGTALDCRAAMRYGGDSDGRMVNLGFRLARIVPVK